MAQDELTLE